MSIIKEILNRRIPHILGSYIVAATSLVLFIDWLSARYEFPQYYTTIALFGIISIIPSVFILAYFHGAPGKDQWSRIEKIGVPINILFIGIIIIIGTRYEFWLNNKTKNEQLLPKRLIIASITSDKENIHPSIAKMNKYEGGSNIKLEILSNVKKNNIYDELITYLETNYSNSNIEYYTKYQLNEDSNKRGEKTRTYSFKYLRMSHASGIDSQFDKFKIMSENDNSLYNYREKTSSDFAYFPLLYKINHSEISNEYFIYHTLTHMQIIPKGHDTTYMYRDPVNFKIIHGDDLVEYMADYILQQYREYIMINEGVIIEMLEDNEILFTYDKSKNLLKKRIILNAKREYRYRVNVDDFDDFINKRLDDLISYEYNVDKIPTSKYYNKYYNNNLLDGPNKEMFMGLTSFTRDELNMIIDGNHPFYKNEGQSGMQYGYPIHIGISVQVAEVYDSTAIAVVYQSEDPNIKLRVGDFIKY